MKITLEWLCGPAQNEPQYHARLIAEELERLGFSDLNGCFKKSGEAAACYLFPERFNAMEGTFLLELPNTETEHFEKLMGMYQALTSGKSHGSDDISLLLITMGSDTGGIIGGAIGMNIGEYLHFLQVSQMDDLIRYSLPFALLIGGQAIGAIGTCYAFKRTKANIRREAMNRISNEMEESYLPRMSKSAKPFDYEILGQVPNMPAFISF